MDGWKRTDIGITLNRLKNVNEIVRTLSLSLSRLFFLRLIHLSLNWINWEPKPASNDYPPDRLEIRSIHTSHSVLRLGDLSPQAFKPF